MYVMVEQIVGKEIVSYLLFSVCVFFKCAGAVWKHAK